METLRERASKSVSVDVTPRTLFVFMALVSGIRVFQAKRRRGVSREVGELRDGESGRRGEGEGIFLTELTGLTELDLGRGE